MQHCQSVFGSRCGHVRYHFILAHFLFVEVYVVIMTVDLRKSCDDVSRTIYILYVLVNFSTEHRGELSW